MLIDSLLVATVLFFVLQLFNSRKGWRFLSYFLLDSSLLIGTAYFQLPSLHLVAQGLLVLLLLTVPIQFRAEIQRLLDPTSQTDLIKSKTSLSIIFVSLLVSVILSLMANGINVKVSALPSSVTIEPINLMDGVSANFGKQSELSLIVAAPRSQWRYVDSNAFTAVVDLAGKGEGTYDVPVAVSSKLPDVHIIRSATDRVVVTVEPIIKKTVPVVAKFSGKAGNELVPDDPVIDPDKIEISGPKSVVSDLTQVIAPIALNGETTDFDQKVTVIALDSDGQPLSSVKMSVAQVQLHIALVKAGKLKTVAIRPVITGSPASGYWASGVEVAPSVVTVTGKVDDLDALTQVPTQPISIAGDSAAASAKVNLDLPTGISLAEDPGQIQVKITFSKTAAVKTVNPQINYQNADSGLKVNNLSATTISAVISGPADTLTTIDGQIKVTLDLAAYKSAGKYSVSITSDSFTLPDGVTLISFLPSAIDVTLDNR